MSKGSSSLGTNLGTKSRGRSGYTGGSAGASPASDESVEDAAADEMCVNLRVHIAPEVSWDGISLSCRGVNLILSTCTEATGSMLILLEARLSASFVKKKHLRQTLLRACKTGALHSSSNATTRC